MIFNYDVSALRDEIQEVTGDVNKWTETTAINFDTETRFIVYFDYANSTGTKPDITENGYLVTFQRSNNYATQFAWGSRDDDGDVFIRRKKAGTWSDWASISHGSLNTKELTPTIVETLPAGITAITTVSAVQSGNVVSVSISITRDSTTITNYTTIATGMPIPKKRPMSGSNTVPFGQISAASSTQGRPLNVAIGSTGNLNVSRGEVAGQYLGTFTYITDEA